MINNNYNLIDSGDGRRLESWAGVVVDRPAPQAVWPKNRRCVAWGQAVVFFDKERNEWNIRGELPEEWYFNFDKIKAKLSLSASGQVGVFPEQMTNWQWIDERLARASRSVKILNAFGYTGMSTLMASVAGDNTEVWHIDSGKSFVNWAHENAELSGLETNKIHWVVEDAIRFFEREVRRGHLYDGIILDPPAFGRAGNRVWKISRDLSRLVELMGQILVEESVMVCFSWHEASLPSLEVKRMLSHLSQLGGRKFEELDLIIPATDGHDLPAGKCVRV